MLNRDSGRADYGMLHSSRMVIFTREDEFLIYSNRDMCHRAVTSGVRVSNYQGSVEKLRETIQELLEWWGVKNTQATGPF